MVRNDIKNSSLLKTKFLIYAFNGRTSKTACNLPFFLRQSISKCLKLLKSIWWHFLLG